MNKIITIGSRGSPLSQKQSEIVKERLKIVRPDIIVKSVIIQTRGDRDQNPIPLDTVGKGWFTKEIEKELLKGKIDLAVHSLKDLPEELPEGLKIGAVLEREDARDVLISKNDLTLEKLPAGARIGTDSLRRRIQLTRLKDGLEVYGIRGNIHTRLSKLENSDCDGLMLAAAGLNRLGLSDRISQFFSPEEITPSPGQGALAIEIRGGDSVTEKIIGILNHLPTSLATRAERIFAKTTGGGCKSPVGAYAEINGNSFILTGMIASLDGKKMVREKISGSKNQSGKLARKLAEDLLNFLN